MAGEIARIAEIGKPKLYPLINADDTDQAGQIMWRLLKFQIGTRLTYLGHCTKKTFSGLLPDL
jgi:hypothetical protein